MDNPGDILRRVLIECPHCLIQREARLKAELRDGELTLALARSIRNRLVDSEAEFLRITGQTLNAYIASRRKAAPVPPAA